MRVRSAADSTCTCSSYIGLVIRRAQRKPTSRLAAAPASAVPTSRRASRRSDSSDPASAASPCWRSREPNSRNAARILSSRAWFCVSVIFACASSPASNSCTARRRVA